jgi:hypothetical protein
MFRVEIWLCISYTYTHAEIHEYMYCLVYACFRYAFLKHIDRAYALHSFFCIQIHSGIHDMQYTHIHTHTYTQASSAIPASVSYQPDSLSTPSVATYNISPLDTQETVLGLGQEVASPVLTMVHSPGSIFTNSIEVALPVNSRIREWHDAAQQAEALAALGVRRTANAGKHHQDAHGSDTSGKTAFDDASQNLLLHGFTSDKGSAGIRKDNNVAEIFQEPHGSVSSEYLSQSSRNDLALGRDVHSDDKIQSSEPNRVRLSNTARRAGADESTTYTQLLLHWFNSQTLLWVPAKGGVVTDGKLKSELPHDVLNNPAFSGKVANLLATTTDPPELPVCGKFQDLVAGNIYACICRYMYVCMYMGYVAKFLRT